MVVHKNRLETCLFSTGSSSQPKALRLHQSRGQSLPVPRGSLWHFNHPPLVDKNHGHFHKNVEAQGNSLLCLPGRHPRSGSLPPASGKAHSFHAANFEGGRHDCQSGQVNIDHNSANHAFGLPHRLQTGSFFCAPSKAEISEERSGQSGFGKSTSPRKMSQVLGGVRSFLQAMPFLRAFTDHMLSFIQKCHWGWDISHPIPESLKAEVRELKVLLQQWAGRPFSQAPPVRTIHSDSSDWAWAGVDCQGNLVRDFWRQQADWHINLKELAASIRSVKSLARPGESICLAVDNTVCQSYLSKTGGRLASYNALIRDLFHWCQGRKISLQIQRVKSADCWADSPSRWPDKNDYALNRELFQFFQKSFSEWVRPTVDVFASPSNTQLPLFISRYQHWDSFLVDALHCTLDQVQHC